MKHGIRISLLAAALVAGTALAAPTTGVTSTPPASVNKSGVGRADASFIEQAGAAGLAEVEAGRLALQKGSSEGVKQLANMLIDDHTKANERLNTVAALKNLSPPSEPGEANRKQLARLNGVSGKDFDEEFLKQQRAAHQEAIALFSKQAKSGKDPDLKKFAADTLPRLQAHLKHVEALQGGKHAGQ
ncbi:DUF4142 domain-containing protein [Chitiniphilus eburneus]|nr:DUF4142 domain-containing protein [Chitiniphilus eburneus]